MPVSWQIAPSPSAARSMFCAMIVSACAGARAGRLGVERVLHRRAHVGRQVGRGRTMSCRTLSKKGRAAYASQYNVLEAEASTGHVTFRTERDPLGELEVPADAYYGVQTRAPSRTFPSAACARPPISSPRPSSIKKAARRGQRRARPARPRHRRRHRRRRRRDPRRRSCAISSSSTCIRRAPAPRTT